MADGVKLEQLDGGFVARDVDAALAEVGPAVVDHWRKGKVTLTIEIVPDKDSERLVAVVTKVKVDKPTREGHSIYYRTLDGDLSRRDPQQPELWPEADSETGEITS